MKTPRRILIAACAWAALAGASHAIPYIPPPQPVQDAPIDRALENVARMGGIEPARRAQLLGRLNLLAYMRNDAPFAFLTENGELVEAGSVLCREAPQGMRNEPPPRDYGANERCARWTFELGPQNEIPEDAQAPQNASAAALARLSAAAQNYAQAVRLAPQDLRARLGYAYVLDRLGKKSAARRQLREITRIGLPQISGPQSDWETHAVLTEAATHLSMLAQSRADRQRITRLRERLQASQPIIYVTPMVVPLADAPFENLADRQSAVAFDFAGTGDRRAQGWLSADAAWLVWDPRGRGEIRSGFDLIGSVTWAAFWRDGFQVLRALDDDRNGRVDGAELSGLALCRDANGNGMSEAGEVLPIAAHQIESLATQSLATQDLPAQGVGDPELLIAEDGVRFSDGRVRPLYDWIPQRRERPVS
ncbi:MAG: hypothetical protein AB7O04_00485 [Hyphomonadaceae bacterium]